MPIKLLSKESNTSKLKIEILNTKNDRIRQNKKSAR